MHYLLVILLHDSSIAYGALYLYLVFSNLTILPESIVRYVVMFSAMLILNYFIYVAILLNPRYYKRIPLMITRIFPIALGIVISFTFKAEEFHGITAVVIIMTWVTIMVLFWDMVRSFVRIARTRETPLLREKVLITTHRVSNPSLADLDCSICYERYGRGDLKSVLPCEHTYHQFCIAQWLQERNSCPLCRVEID